MSILVERAREPDAVLGVRPLPAIRLSRLQHIVIVSEQFLATHNVLERDMGRISQHIV